MNQQGNIILIVLVIVAMLLALVIGIGIRYYLNPQEPAPENKIIDTTSNCGNISDIQEREQCYIELAVDKKDITICDKFLSGSPKMTGCYFQTIVKNKDLQVNVCSIAQDKNDCYATFANINNDISLCDNLSDALLKDRCYQVMLIDNKDYNACNKVNVQNKNLIPICYAYVAINNDDLKICDRDSNLRDACYAVVAFTKKDLKICENIEDISLKGQCQVEIKELMK